MIEYLYWSAVALGCVSALLGSRTAMALLASTAISYAMNSTGAEFETLLWLALDMAIIIAILAFRMRWPDWIVLALFVPAWGLYLMDEWTRFYGVTFIIIAQYLVTFPWSRLMRRVVRTLPCRETMDDIFNLRVRTGALWSERKM